MKVEEHILYTSDNHSINLVIPRAVLYFTGEAAEDIDEDDFFEDEDENVKTKPFCIHNLPFIFQDDAESHGDE
jgi:hypothetical protein